MPKLPSRLRPMPRRQRVRRIPLMKNRKRSHVIFRRKVGIKLRQKLARTHRLVDNRLRRQRTDIPRHISLRMRPLKLLPREIQPPFHRSRLACRAHRPPAPAGSAASCSSAISPSHSVQTGTSRQPSITKSCDSRQRSSSASARVSPAGRNNMPTPSNCFSSIARFAAAPAARAESPSSRLRHRCSCRLPPSRHDAPAGSAPSAPASECHARHRHQPTRQTRRRTNRDRSARQSVTAQLRRHRVAAQSVRVRRRQKPFHASLYVAPRANARLATPFLAKVFYPSVGT